MITVSINSQTCILTKDVSLFAALEQNGFHAQKGIAVAVNNSVVPRAEWQGRTLRENDKVTIIRATQGG